MLNVFAVMSAFVTKQSVPNLTNKHIQILACFKSFFAFLELIIYSNPVILLLLVKQAWRRLLEIKSLQPLHIQAKTGRPHLLLWLLVMIKVQVNTEPACCSVIQVRMRFDHLFRASQAALARGKVITKGRVWHTCRRWKVTVLTGKVWKLNLI